MDKILISYYSKTGNTKKIVQLLKEELGNEFSTDLEEIKDLKNRNGFFGFIRSGRDSLKKNHTEIGPLKQNPEKYDIIILATPVWAGNITPAIRTYMDNNRSKIKKFALITSSGGTVTNDKLNNIASDFGTPIAVASLCKKDFESGTVKQIIQSFIQQCKK